MIAGNSKISVITQILKGRFFKNMRGIGNFLFPNPQGEKKKKKTITNFKNLAG